MQTALRKNTHYTKEKYRKVFKMLNSVSFKKTNGKSKCYNYIKFSKMCIFRAFFVEKSINIQYNKLKNKNMKRECEENEKNNQINQNFSGYYFNYNNISDLTIKHMRQIRQ